MENRERGVGVREEGGAVLRLWLCLRAMERAGTRAAELGGALGRGLGGEGGVQR